MNASVIKDLHLSNFQISRAVQILYCSSFAFQVITHLLYDLESTNACVNLFCSAS